MAFNRYDDYSEMDEFVSIGDAEKTESIIRLSDCKNNTLMWAKEYELLVKKFYPDQLNRRVADRMLELERLLRIETLVPMEWR